MDAADAMPPAEVPEEAPHGRSDSAAGSRGGKKWKAKFARGLEVRDSPVPWRAPLSGSGGKPCRFPSPTVIRSSTHTRIPSHPPLARVRHLPTI